MYGKRYMYSVVNILLTSLLVLNIVIVYFLHKHAKFLSDFNFHIPFERSVHSNTNENGHTTCHNSEERYSGLKEIIRITWLDYVENPNLKTCNPLIDEYGLNNQSKIGENGTTAKLVFLGKDRDTSEQLRRQYGINVKVSDAIPLNRMVPDSRFPGCKFVQYSADLPSVTVIIPVMDEWLSVLLRTIYSVINRTPRRLLQEIILVDDCSTNTVLKRDLDDYIFSHFPQNLIKIVHLKERQGVVNARLEGWRLATGQVLVFLDSHMEVNTDWLRPLLEEIKRDRKTVAMAVLDYIDKNTFEYTWYDRIVRYGFNWNLVVFESFFRPDQLGPDPLASRSGVVMIGSAFAIERKYFEELGTYDDGMKIWGGENLEMSWRIWLCGGRLVHVPCSHIGHIARSQPYSFPRGRGAVENYNYKRAVEVWMETRHRKYVYDVIRGTKDLDVGNLTDRMKLKDRLKCKSFRWFLDNIWPELLQYDVNVTAWGELKNHQRNMCLDTARSMSQMYAELYSRRCNHRLDSQGFSLMINKQLRTSLHCVFVDVYAWDGDRPFLQDCLLREQQFWTHEKGKYIRHDRSGLCLDLDHNGPVMKTCRDESASQKWSFTYYN